MCQHGKLHALTARKVNCISEKMYRDIQNIIQQYSHKYITSEGIYGLSTQKSKNCDIEYDLSFCSYCTKSLCLEINKKMNVL